MSNNHESEFLHDLLESQQLGVLATQENDIPYTNLVAFSPTSNLNGILFATLRNTAKYQNLSKNEKVSILFDNRKNDVSDFTDAKTATAIGRAHEVDKKQYRDLYLSKHPNLADFVNNPNCALVMISVDKYILVEDFQKKTKLEF